MMGIQLSADRHAGSMLGDERIEPREDRALMGARADDGEARACFQHRQERVEQRQRTRSGRPAPVLGLVGAALRTGHVPERTNTAARTDPLDPVDDPLLELRGGFVRMAAQDVRRFRGRPVSAERTGSRSMSIDDEDLYRTAWSSEFGHAAPRAGCVPIRERACLCCDPRASPNISRDIGVSAPPHAARKASSAGPRRQWGTLRWPKTGIALAAALG